MLAGVYMAGTALNYVTRAYMMEWLPTYAGGPLSVRCVAMHLVPFLSSPPQGYLALWKPPRPTQIFVIITVGTLNGWTPANILQLPAQQ